MHEGIFREFMDDELVEGGLCKLGKKTSPQRMLS